MKRYILLLGLLLAFFAPAWAQDDNSEADVVLNTNLPTGFNYQALIYADGQPVADKEIKLRITLQDQQKSYLVEEHTAKTTSTGWVEVLVGSMNPAEMQNVPWEKNLLVKVEVDLGSGTFIALGEPVKMMPVPYALYARTAPLIKGNGDKDAPIFQVRNSRDLPIFTVYEDAITMNVTEVPKEARRPRGGFAVKSFRLSENGTELAPSLSLNDGALSVFVDPVLRRPRGGFAVKTFKTDLRGANETEDLFSTDERATYFTIDQCKVGSTFQFRDRDEESKVIMNMKDGYIQTIKGANKSEVVEKLPDRVAQLSYKWLAPGSVPSMTSPAMPIEFTNLMRWLIPYAEVEGKAIAYNIAIQDEGGNNQGKKLSDYFTVGKVLRPHTDKVQEVEAVILKSNVRVQENEGLPGGKFVISWTDYPNVKESELIYGGLYTFKAGAGLELRADVKVIDPESNVFTGYLQGQIEHKSAAYFNEVLYNLPFKIEVVDPNFNKFVKVINRENAKLYCKILDKDGFFKALKQYKQGRITKIKMRANFNGVYDDFDFECDILH